MLKDRRVLEEHLVECSMKTVADRDKCKALYSWVFDTFNIPKGMIMDLISLRKSYSEVSEFIMFGILSGMHVIKEKSALPLEYFYTEQEVRTYGTAQYAAETIKFPLVFPMIQIVDDQWIGKITVGELMKLRNAQLINYDVNAQRTMQRVIRGDKEYYKIALNKKAVEEIEAAYLSEQFIPNTITLNIPVEQIENEFYYDDVKNVLVITHLDYFNITDGYHRYIAACKTKDAKENFDYNMELRIVHFSERKAQQFIFQEDQKTQMRKIDSNSFNTTKAANNVVTRMNENPMFNLQGTIGRNEGLISFAELAELVDYFYFKGVSNKDNVKALVINVTKKLVADFNSLTEYDEKYLTHNYSFIDLSIIMYCFNVYSNMDSYELCKIIDYALNNTDKLNKKRFSNKKLRSGLVTIIDAFIKECGDNV